MMLAPDSGLDESTELPDLLRLKKGLSFIGWFWSARWNVLPCSTIFYRVPGLSKEGCLRVFCLRVFCDDAIGGLSKTLFKKS